MYLTLPTMSVIRAASLYAADSACLVSVAGDSLRRSRVPCPAMPDTEVLTERESTVSAWRGRLRRSRPGYVLVPTPRTRSWWPTPGWPGSDPGSPGSAPPRRAKGSARSAGTADAGGDRQIRVECLAEFPGVLLGQIDGVVHAVERKLDGSVSVPPSRSSVRTVMICLAMFLHSPNSKDARRIRRHAHHSRHVYHAFRGIDQERTPGACPMPGRASRSAAIRAPPRRHVDRSGRDPSSRGARELWHWRDRSPTELDLDQQGEMRDTGLGSTTSSSTSWENKWGSWTERAKS
jgi:hypothetical protein